MLLTIKCQIPSTKLWIKESTPNFVCNKSLSMTQHNTKKISLSILAWNLWVKAMSKLLFIKTIRIHLIKTTWRTITTVLVVEVIKKRNLFGIQWMMIWKTRLMKYWEIQTQINWSLGVPNQLTNLFLNKQSPTISNNYKNLWSNNLKHQLYLTKLLLQQTSNPTIHDMVLQALLKQQQIKIIKKLCLNHLTMI